jgi:putative component of toxin-antitoxin plasmid stabilization module
MNLIELGRKTWRVLAVCDHRDNCQVLSYLRSSQSSDAARRMFGNLRQTIPERGPEFRNKEKVKHLDDGIYEFRIQPKKGPKSRVIFFTDGNSVVVCTEGLDKRNDDLSLYIEKAKDIRERYLADCNAGQIDIKKLSEESK